MAGEAAAAHLCTPSTGHRSSHERAYRSWKQCRRRRRRRRKASASKQWREERKQPRRTDGVNCRGRGFKVRDSVGCGGRHALRAQHLQRQSQWQWLQTWRLQLSLSPRPHRSPLAALHIPSTVLGFVLALEWSRASSGRGLAAACRCRTASQTTIESRRYETR